MRFHLPRTFGSLALGMALILAGCRMGGSNTTTPAPGTAAASVATPSPVASPTASPVASPTAMPSTPTPSPTASPAALAQPVTLAEAMANLEDEGSYVMRIDAAGFAGAESLLPGVGDTFQITLQRSGDDRHVRVRDASGTRIIELWRVNGRNLADIGIGPFAVTQGTPIVGRLLPLLDLPSLFLRALSGDDAAYTVTGADMVDGTPATVEQATYEVTGASRALLVASDTATVDSTMWVATEEQYLLRLDLTLTPTEATPATGAQSATAHVEVSDVGTAPPVTEPAP